MTPAPNPPHEAIALRLRYALDPYVVKHRLGHVQFRRALIFMGSEVEPDLTIAPAPVGESWKGAALPILVVEILSSTTRRRDRLQKRELYMESGVPEYWMVDRQERCITVAQPGLADVHNREELEWRPRRDIEPLRFAVADVFAPFDPADG